MDVFFETQCRSIPVICKEYICELCQQISCISFIWFLRLYYLKNGPQTIRDANNLGVKFGFTGGFRFGLAVNGQTGRVKCLMRPARCTQSHNNTFLNEGWEREDEASELEWKL